MKSGIILLMLLCCATVLSKMGIELPSEGLTCTAHNATLMDRDTIERAMKHAAMQNKDVTRTRLEEHCAAREERTCAVVARMQQNMLQHPESTTWWIGDVDIDVSVCAQMTLHDLGIRSTYRACDGTITTELGPKNHGVDTKFERARLSRTYEWYCGAHLCMERIDAYFQILSECSYQTPLFKRMFGEFKRFCC